jgi:biotin carboxylase
MTALCIASFEKGHALLRELRKQGWSVVLITSASLKDKAKWPMDAIDEIFYMPDVDNKWDQGETVNAVSYLARARQFERIIALDDFDVELAAHLREHLRMPGMGETTVRHFRDKLAMRMKAREAGLTVPEFAGVFNYDRLREFMARVPPPWLLKPRSMAGAIGIKKLANSEELWRTLDALGDMQSHYLVEQFVPGDIFHVDTIVHRGEIRFAIASGYARPPMEVAHQGGIFVTRILERDSEIAAALRHENERVMRALGLRRGASHTEFIRASAGGQIHFLETSGRVGGAHIAELVEAATGLNLWAEWAKVEVAGETGEYGKPADSGLYAGLLISLARQQHPDTSSYTDPEIVWRMERENHVGFIVQSQNHGRVTELLDSYTQRVQADFHAALPPKETATN